MEENKFKWQFQTPEQGGSRLMGSANNPSAGGGANPNMAQGGA